MSTAESSTPFVGVAVMNISLINLHSALPNTTTRKDIELYLNTTENPQGIDYACLHAQAEDTDNMVSTQILLFMSMFFVLLGLLGNSLSIVVFSSKDMNYISSNVYLLVLAISDSLYLITVLFTKTLTLFRCMYLVTVPMDIFNRSTVMCKLLQYLLGLFSDYSACLIMAFTVERFIAVYIPLRYKDVCTVVRAKVTCVIFFLVISTFIAPYHFLFMGRPEGYDVCTIMPQHEHIFSSLYIVEAVVFRVIPVLVIAVLNVHIIIRVTILTIIKRKQKLGNSQNNKKKDDRGLQLTIMLILVSTTYISVYMPVLVNFFLWKLKRSDILDISRKSLMLMQNYTQVLYIGGFAINFFLYTLSGRIFREKLYNIICGQDVTRKRPVKSRVVATEMASLM